MGVILITLLLIKPLLSSKTEFPTSINFPALCLTFKYNKGMRIDYLLTLPLATDKIKSAKIDDFMYEKPKPSDHAPVSLILEI